MTKYHARIGGLNTALCGANGTANGFHVVTLSAKEWNETRTALRCERCTTIIRNLRIASTTKEKGAA